MALTPAERESLAYRTVALCAACEVGALAVAWLLVTSPINLQPWIRFDCIVLVYLATVVLIGFVIGALARHWKAVVWQTKLGKIVHPLGVVLWLAGTILARGDGVGVTLGIAGLLGSLWLSSRPWRGPLLRLLGSSAT